VFAGVFWRRPDIVYDQRAVEIPLSEPLRKNIEDALSRARTPSDSVSVQINGQRVGSSPLLPSTKLPDRLLYVNIRNVGHIPSGRLRTRIVVPGEIADKDVTDAGSAFGSIDKRADSDSKGELSFECPNLANHQQARIKVALWYQQTKPGVPSVEIQDTSLGPAREVGSIETARFYWWDWLSERPVIFVYSSTLLPLLTLVLGYYFARKAESARPNFTAIFDPSQCGWGEGAVQGVPAMQVFATASLATTQEQPIEIVQAYLKGTRPAGNLFRTLVASRESAVAERLEFFVRPVVAKGGEPYRGRIVLVDTLNNKYESEELVLPYRGGRAAKP